MNGMMSNLHPYYINRIDMKGEFKLTNHSSRPNVDVMSTGCLVGSTVNRTVTGKSDSPFEAVTDSNASSISSIAACAAAVWDSSGTFRALVS